MSHETEMLRKVVAAWEVVKSGRRHSRPYLEDLLIDNMEPVINEVRGFLKETEEQERRR
jgi:hypothetical protein